MNAEPTWFKSSHSSNEGGNCVEVAVGPGFVGVRDSKNADGGSLAVSNAEWSAFIAFAAGQPVEGG
ncbi:MAG TPA: DUF397 domain-containing protein [Streptomyces sp.]|nr:DUF397 domain-containing protein [Streptomyces sp.]